VLTAGDRRPIAEVVAALRAAAAGAVTSGWTPPGWLLPHQVVAARRLVASLHVFGGAVLADAVGLGKTYVALALATRYPSVTVAAPAALLPQWRRRAHDVGLAPRVVSHEALSRERALPPADFVIVDEAHHFRNPATKRYDALASGLGGADVLLVTATPVVNRGADLAHLVRLVLPDGALAPLGVPSLEAACRDGATARLVHALAPIVVARGRRTPRMPPLPRAANRDARHPSPLTRRRLERCLAEIDALTFPSFGPDAGELLRRHLLYRLASSWDACRETLRRHATYLRRAAEAAARGEALDRRAARRLFGPDDDPQLSFASLEPPRAALDVRAMDTERARIERLMTDVASAARAPKVDALVHLVRCAPARKTLIFTVARRTALRLAAALAWRRVAVVAAGRGRIASGPIRCDEAFDLFAPIGRAHGHAPRAAGIDILIATDLASEGLDLQDAERLVNYDLPWTPLRLEQRLGRLVRLGSPHRRVDIDWFVPCAALERRLELGRLLREKLRTQLAHGVAASSVPGRARVIGGAFAARERLILAQPTGAPCRASVRGRGRAVVALGWHTDRGMVSEIFAVDGPSGAIVDDFEAIADRLRALAHEPAAPHGGMAWVTSAICALVRARLATVATGPVDPFGRRLVRRIVRRASVAARRRDPTLLDLLDRALARVRAGLRIGGARTLDVALDARALHTALREWLARTPLRTIEWRPPTLLAVLSGGPESGPPFRENRKDAIFEHSLPTPGPEHQCPSAAACYAHSASPIWPTAHRSRRGSGCIASSPSSCRS